MNENLTTSAKILAAKYASNSDVMFYHEALPGLLAALLIVAVLALVAIVGIVLDAISKEPTENFKEVNYDYRSMGRKRDQNSDRERES